MKVVQSIALCIATLIFAKTSAQQQDFVGMSGIQVNKSLSRSVDVSLSTQGTFNQNLSELWFAFTDGSIGYRFSRNWSTEFHARYIQFRKMDNAYDNRQLFYNTLTWSKGFGPWSISLRNRLQQLIFGEHFRDDFKGPVWYNRDRLSIRYRFNYYWSVFTATELFVPLNHVLRQGIDQYRIAAGATYTYNDYLRLDTYYQIQQQLQRPKGNNMFFVLGLNATIRIP